jgi:hypothetical protein
LNAYETFVCTERLIGVSNPKGLAFFDHGSPLAGFSNMLFGAWLGLDFPFYRLILGFFDAEEEDDD